ncbi:hypothetical protein Enr13x_43000 [Stieleria neptunia]|uniref:Uncharacterized protein n=1 Tax=Stieleria neptunia TaxID=2527979 RepID=A0A518HUD9_9BACT|nr:hypothetical protein [Stieleria neptunia]QDV44434.1 hypothetical protein Enr13x_43000 [Stieleria neptunia]
MNETFIQQMIEAPLETTAQYFADCLPRHQKAISFLKTNHLIAGGDLNVGFSDRTLGKLLPANATQAFYLPRCRFVARAAGDCFSPIRRFVGRVWRSGRSGCVGVSALWDW